MRSCAHAEIVSMFFMDKKPEDLFDPSSTGFKDLVRYALEMAFNDFNFRTLTKTEAFTEAFKKEYSAWEESVKVIRKQRKKQDTEKLPPEPRMTEYLITRLDDGGFLERFVDYFTEACRDQTQFDDWHNETCELFLKILDGTGEFQRYTKVYTGLAYGKAQKIVNMMFKHLYCLNGADAWENYFEHCHLVLDNFTLEWFKRNLKQKRIESWSNLVYRKTSVDHNDYLFYQEKIREHFLPKDSQTHTYAGLTPFQAEFYIWPEIQWRMAAEGLLNQKLLSNVMRSGSKIASETDIVDNCEKLIEQLVALKASYSS